MSNGEISRTIIEEIEEGIKNSDYAQRELDKTQTSDVTCGAPHTAMVNCMRGQTQMLKGIARYIVNSIKEKQDEKKMRHSANYASLLKLVIALLIFVIGVLVARWF